MQFHPIRALRTMFGYHATVDKKRRTAPISSTRSEDKQLDITPRRTLIATAREQYRNFSVLAWMVREHTNFLSRFEFQPQTDNEDLNKQLERLTKWRSRRRNWDITWRFNRQEFMRILEMRRVVDGDIGIVSIPDGHYQAIEGDRIAMPTSGAGGLPEQQRQTGFAHGVKLNRFGRPLRYIVCKRELTGSTNRAGGSTLVFDKMVNAADMRLLGYYDRFDEV